MDLPEPLATAERVSLQLQQGFSTWGCSCRAVTHLARAVGPAKRNPRVAPEVEPLQGRRRGGGEAGQRRRGGGGAAEGGQC